MLKAFEDLQFTYLVIRRRYKVDYIKPEEKAPNRTIDVPSGARLAVFETCFHGVTPLLEVKGGENVLQLHIKCLRFVCSDILFYKRNQCCQGDNVV